LCCSWWATTRRSDAGIPPAAVAARPVHHRAGGEPGRRYAAGTDLATPAAWGAGADHPDLPQSLRHVAERPDFSFADCIKRPLEYPVALAEWVGRMFFAFRDMELRLQMADFGSMFKP